MLGQMGTDQSLAGPVQGGNMVVKPNQVPVGGAAMLSKALRRQADKGVGGMYVLPEQEESMPGFMQMAQQNVNEDMTRMARTVEAEAPPGHMLSYITPEEAGILKLLGGTGDINPVTGIPQFADKDEYGGSEKEYTKQWSGDYGRQDYDRGRRNIERMAEKGRTDQDILRDIKAGGTQQPGLPRVEEEEVSQGETEIIDKQNEVNTAKKKLEEIKKTGTKEEIIAAETNVKEKETLLEKFLGKISSIKDKIMVDDSEETIKNKKRIEELLKKAKGDVYSLKGSERKELEKLQLKTGPLPSGLKALMAGGQALGDAFSKPKTEQFYDDNYLNILEKEILPGYGGTRDEQITAFFNEYDDIIPAVEGAAGQSLTGEAALRKRLDEKAGIEQGSDLQKRLEPHKYWKDFKGGTSGDMEELAQVSLQGLSKSPEDRKLGAKIMEAREIASRQHDAQDARMGGGRPRFMDAVEEEVIETPTGVIDEEAQTMAYTGPRTGGVETQVPLQRRFKTDPTKAMAQYTTTPRTQEDIYKYMTEGTTGEGIGLEPFSEYQKRRRKALGLEPLGLWS